VGVRGFLPFLELRRGATHVDQLLDPVACLDGLTATDVGDRRHISAEQSRNASGRSDIADIDVVSPTGEGIERRSTSTRVFSSEFPIIYISDSIDIDMDEWRWPAPDFLAWIEAVRPHVIEAARRSSVSG
jgi:hypothetical protein